MSPGVFGAVLFAAALHATWNAIVKRGGETRLTTVMVATAAALIAAVALPFLGPPARASWPSIAASTVFQAGYCLLLAQAYRLADMSQAYPLMRGTAPLLVAIAGAAGLGEPLSAPAWLGVGVICAGVLGMAAEARRGASRTGLSLALANAVVIAGYTLIDGAGVRRSGAPASYTLWIFLLTGLALGGWAMLGPRAAFASHLRGHWRAGLVGGAGALGSYGIALWAMTLAPVALVAALRETAILFGAAISAFVLRERVGPVRIAAACVIAAGAAVLRLG
jgi:drug/metabolite transporter (DMT)-like permease